MMKRMLSLVLALIMLLSLSSLFSACNKSDDGAEETTAGDGASENYSDFLVSHLSEACIVYPSGASDALIRSATSLASTIKDTLGVELKVRSDYYNPDFEEFDELKYEIVIGRCSNREESEQFGATVRVNDFGYSIIGTKIVICGGSDGKTSEAVRHFAEKIVKNSDGKAESVFMSTSMAYMTAESYAIESVKLGGALISEYIIVYPALSPKSEIVHAERLADLIEQASGYSLRIKSDEATKGKYAKEIRLGNTDRKSDIVDGLNLDTNEYYIGNDSDGAIIIAGKDITALIGAVDKIVSDIKSSGKNVELDYSTPAKGKSLSKEITVMTYNVFYKGVSGTRVKNVISDILSNMPDSIGFQEVTSTWLDKLKKELGQYYDWVGEPRSSGSEYNCVFYRKDLYKLLDSGTKWLSNTPDKKSKLSGSTMNRIMTYAKLQRKSDGKVYVHVNTHLEHNNIPVSTEQAKILINLVNKYFKNDTVLLTGDFNSQTGNGPWIEITKVFEDSKLVAPENEANMSTKGSSHIDMIFVKGSTYPMKHDILKDRGYIEGETSDHFAVLLKTII